MDNIVSLCTNRYGMAEAIKLQVIDYKDKACAIIGDSRSLKDKINQYRANNNNIGTFTNLYGTQFGAVIKGWLFPRTHSENLKELLAGTFNNVVDITENVTVIETKVAEPKHTIKGLQTYLIENMSKLITAITGEMDVTSIVKNDTVLLPDDGKRYVFLGCGCGFSYIKFDGRNKLAAQIVEDSKICKKFIEEKMLKALKPEYLANLERLGNPIEAHMAQNLNYKSDYNNLIVRYMEQFIDIKKAKVWVQNLDD